MLRHDPSGTVQPAKPEMTRHSWPTPDQWPPMVVVVDNGTYGTIRMHQEMHYPGAQRTIATDLKNPDFVRYAQAFGAFGVRCETTADFPAALAAARTAGRPALVHLITSAEDIAPNRTITGLRAK